MGVFDFFDATEVKAALALFEIERKKAKGIMLSLGYELVRLGVRKALKAKPTLLNKKLYNEKIELTTLLHLMVVNECGALMQSGRYHSTLGGHLMQGEALIALWHFGARNLEHIGFWSVDRASSAREAFHQQCAR